MCIFSLSLGRTVVALAGAVAALSRRTTLLLSFHLCAFVAHCRRAPGLLEERTTTTTATKTTIVFDRHRSCLCTAAAPLSFGHRLSENTYACLCTLLALFAPSALLSFWFATSQRPQQPPPSPAPNGRQRRNSNTIVFTNRPTVHCRHRYLHLLNYFHDYNYKYHQLVLTHSPLIITTDHTSWPIESTRTKSANN